MPPQRLSCPPVCMHTHAPLGATPQGQRGSHVVPARYPIPGSGLAYTLDASQVKPASAPVHTIRPAHQTRHRSSRRRCRRRRASGEMCADRLRTQARDSECASSALRTKSATSKLVSMCPGVDTATAPRVSRAPLRWPRRRMRGDVVRRAADRRRRRRASTSGLPHGRPLPGGRPRAARRRGSVCALQMETGYRQQTSKVVGLRVTGQRRRTACGGV
jgi:hypothetical protein